MPTLNELPQFEEHQLTNCTVCRYSRKQWTSPRKRPPTDDKGGDDEQLQSTPKKKAAEQVSRSLLESLSPISESSKSVTRSHLSNQSVNESLSLTSSMNATPSDSANSSFTHAKTVDESVLDQSEVSVPELTSISADRFVEKGIAEQIKCTICLGVPLSPTVTPCCEHFNYKECITAWLETSETCTNCRSHLTVKDVSEVAGFKENVYDVLHVHCKYANSGCTFTPSAKNLLEHEQNCTFKVKIRQVRGKGRKKNYPKLKIARAAKMNV